MRQRKRCNNFKYFEPTPSPKVHVLPCSKFFFMQWQKKIQIILHIHNTDCKVSCTQDQNYIIPSEIPVSIKVGSACYDTENSVTLRQWPEDCDINPFIASYSCSAHTWVLPKHLCSAAQNQLCSSKHRLIVYYSLDLGAGTVCWFEPWTHDRKVVSSNPSKGSGRNFFSRINFVRWLSFGVRSIPMLPQWHVNPPSLPSIIGNHSVYGIHKG